jgi:2-hydroxymuconate-semialdehyde hydrolase
MPLSTVEIDPSNIGERGYVEALEAFGQELDVAFASRLEKVDGDRVHYLEAGSGPPLLCLHGITTTAATWLPLVESLADEYRVLAVDRLGRGLSAPIDYTTGAFRDLAVDYLTGLLDALDVAETRVLGNSLGGLQAFMLQLDHPERVTRTCLVGAPGGLDRSVPLAFRLPYLPKIGPWLFRRAISETVAEERDRWAQFNVEDASAIPDGMLAVEVASERVPGQTDSLVSLACNGGTLRGGMHESLIVRDELADSEIPTRFVWGSEDAFWPPSVGRPVVDAMPDAAMTVLQGHGHTPWLEPTTDARDAVLDALE